MDFKYYIFNASRTKNGFDITRAECIIHSPDRNYSSKIINDVFHVGWHFITKSGYKSKKKRIVEISDDEIIDDSDGIQVTRDCFQQIMGMAESRNFKIYFTPDQKRRRKNAKANIDIVNNGYMGNEANRW